MAIDACLVTLSNSFLWSTEQLSYADPVHSITINSKKARGDTSHRNWQKLALSISWR